MEEKKIADYTFSDFVRGFFRFVAILFAVKLFLGILFLIVVFGGIGACQTFFSESEAERKARIQKMMEAKGFKYPSPTPSATPRKR